MKSSWMSACTIAMPSEVHRWPAVPNPLNSAPSTARSRSASGITTSGFLPPSSRHGDCRCRPQSSPIRRPTSVEPVKPDLVDQVLVERALEPLERVRAVREDHVERAAGNPACRNSCANASAVAGVYSAGFHTTALPQSSAGTRYHDGTATGKFPAVMMAATPTGVRNVNSCLSGISDGTVWP